MELKEYEKKMKGKCFKYNGDNPSSYFRLKKVLSSHELDDGNIGYVCIVQQLFINKDNVPYYFPESPVMFKENDENVIGIKKPEYNNLLIKYGIK